MSPDENYSCEGMRRYCDGIEKLLTTGHTLILDSEMRDDGPWFRFRTREDRDWEGGWRALPEHALQHLIGRLEE